MSLADPALLAIGLLAAAALAWSAIAVARRRAAALASAGVATANRRHGPGRGRDRARLRTGVEERDARLAAGMRRAGVPIHRVGTSDDLATALIEVVTSTRRRRA